MAKTLLAQLRTMTTVVGDTGDIEAIEKVKAAGCERPNPSLLTAAAQLPQYGKLVDGVLLDAKKQLGEDAEDAKVSKLAFENLAVAFGKKILQDSSPGGFRPNGRAQVVRHRGDDRAGALDHSEVRERGVSRQRVLIKIASTWRNSRRGEAGEGSIHCAT